MEKMTKQDGSSLDMVTENLEAMIKILLHGLTGPLDGKAYSGIMAPFGTQSDEWIASVASYVRSAWDNRASYVSKEEVEIIRENHIDRTRPWVSRELQ